MANKDTENEPIRITHNVLNQNDFLGKPKRQWAEAIAFTFLFFLIVSAIPFTTVVRWVIFLVFGGAILFIGIRGIKNRSLIEIIIGEVKFLKRKRILHLYGPEYKRQKGVAAGGQDTSMSDAERIIEYVKQKVTDFTDKYADS